MYEIVEVKRRPKVGYLCFLFRCSKTLSLLNINQVIVILFSCFIFLVFTFWPKHYVFKRNSERVSWDVLYKIKLFKISAVPIIITKKHKNITLIVPVLK